jgi:antitoxin (DNA-binding transcriptional repressor) of toxin-antitoxin stability system
VAIAAHRGVIADPDAMGKTIGAAKFKEHCLAILDELTPDGIVITKHGKPVAELVPFVNDGVDLIGSLRGKIEIRVTRDRRIRESKLVPLA